MLNKKQSTWLLFFLIFVMAAFFLYKKSANSNIANIKINGKVIRAEVATGAQSMELGLGGREALCRDCGMLFKFPEPGKYSFWMNGMKFPLDIIWIRENKIVHIEKNIPADSGIILTPNESADSVLELPAGKVDETVIQNGDAVSGY